MKAGRDIHRQSKAKRKNLFLLSFKCVIWELLTLKNICLPEDNPIFDDSHSVFWPVYQWNIGLVVLHAGEVHLNRVKAHISQIVAKNLSLQHLSRTIVLPEPWQPELPFASEVLNHN